MQSNASMVSPSPQILSDSGERRCSLVHPVVFFTDKQVITLVSKINGKGKVLDQKQLWAGVYWFLRWYSSFPVDPKKFCKRINAMPGAESFEISCCYNNMRKLAYLSFMDYDCRKMDEVKFSNNDRHDFCYCREVVLALLEKLLEMEVHQKNPVKMGL